MKYNVFVSDGTVETMFDTVINTIEFQNVAKDTALMIADLCNEKGVLFVLSNASDS